MMVGMAPLVKRELGSGILAQRRGEPHRPMRSAMRLPARSDNCTLARRHRALEGGSKFFVLVSPTSSLVVVSVLRWTIESSNAHRR